MPLRGIIIIMIGRAIGGYLRRRIQFSYHRAAHTLLDIIIALKDVMTMTAEALVADKAKPKNQNVLLPSRMVQLLISQMARFQTGLSLVSIT